MTILVTVVDQWQGHWCDPSNTGKGKFYNTIIVKAEDAPAGLVYYAPVYNSGSGHYNGHTTGAFNFGKFHRTQRDATDEGAKQMRRKIKAGYQHDPSALPAPPSHAAPPQKVVDLVTNHIVAATTGPFTSGPATPAPAAQPRYGAAIKEFAAAFEAKAAKVLTAGDVDKACTMLAELKADFGKFTVEYERVEAALEMASLQVRARLSA